MGYSGMGGWGATPETKEYLSALFNLPPVQVSKNTCAHRCGTVVWLLQWPPAQWVRFKTPIPGIHKHLCWPMGYTGKSFRGATPEAKEILLALWSLNITIPRYPKAPVLTHGVQRYECLGRHPRPQRIFFGTVQFKHSHPRYPKTPVLAFAVQQ